ncbi:LysR family transcriptional regulator [Clostridium sp. AF18-27]|uniref:LysR substrate-binding domain-containing protein n=1 Tax=Enterocloster lavalensis TaxID=460384 RepID=UPI000E54A90E|nr:LysR substrate-binding domain-containing protein [Enterocloster lavalensis]RHR44301.1 LysR family transcriptional regulator [Clostridium sp. AF18-27]
MNGKQLRYITAIAETGSIRGGAALLGKDASTMARTLKKMEQDFNVRLFRRTPEGLRTTPEGEAVLGIMEEIVRSCEVLHGGEALPANKALTDREILPSSEVLPGSEALPSSEALPGSEALPSSEALPGSEALPSSEALPGTRAIPARPAGSNLTEQEIRYLLTIRDCGSISRAAAELYIAQPSLSQVLRQVEEEFGLMIFKRTSRGVEPTEAGRVLLDRLHAIRGLYRRLELTVEEFQDMKRGTITFGVPQNLGAYLLPMVLPAFSAQYPGIRVRFRENNSTELDRLLLADKTDFSIMHFQEENTALAYEAFFDDPFYLVIPGGMTGRFGFTEGRKLLEEDLQPLGNLPFIMVARGQKLRQVADQILETCGITPDIRFETKSMETAKRLTAAGLGVTFLPGSYLTLYSGMEGLACFQLDESLGASWQLVAAYPKKGGLSRSAREFLRVLGDCLADHRA